MSPCPDTQSGLALNETGFFKRLEPWGDQLGSKHPSSVNRLPSLLNGLRYGYSVTVRWESRIYAQINGCWLCKDQPERRLTVCIIHSIAIKVNDSRLETPDVILNKPSVKKTKRSNLNKYYSTLSTANLAAYDRYPNTVAAGSDACVCKREVSLMEAAPQIGCLAYRCSNHTCEPDGNSMDLTLIRCMTLCVTVNNRLSGLQVTTSADSLSVFSISFVSDDQPQDFFSDQQKLNGAVGRSALFHGSQSPSLHLTSSLLISFTRSFEACSRSIYKILKLSPSESIVEQRNSKAITYSKSTYIAQLLEKASQAPSTLFHRERLFEASSREYAELSCLAGT